MINQEILSIKQRFSIIGNSALLNRAIQVASQVAPTDLSVLILGESGTGKESFSKIIHSLSRRKHGEFIAINCGAIPAGTVASELFGHEKDSFTGANRLRKGYFETVDGGTIFLDEIGELPEEVQSMLLRLLESGEFVRVGGSKVMKTDVRVIAATNVDLLKAVEEGKFREDLYFRLNTVPIYVPALRERGKDIELLFRKFAYDFAEEYRVDAIKLSEDAKIILMKYRFPGNIRQLKNLVSQISVLEVEDKVISAEKLVSYLPKEQKSNLPALVNSQSENEKDFSEREILYKVLFDMRKDVNELKKLVFQMLENGALNADTLQNHKELFEDIDNTDFSTQTTNSLMLSPKYENPVINFAEDNAVQNVEEEITHDTVYEEENNTLSLEETEKELIKKALKKHNNKRKYAAQELGISERTLYRKIKQYSIDKQ